MNFIPYGRQSITDEDIEALVSVLKSDMITQGPAIAEFENNFAREVNAPFACAVCNASAGLHLAYQVLGVQKGDIVWTCPNTFVATANAALYIGASIDFVDIDPKTFCMSVDALSYKLQKANQAGNLPKLVVPVHFAGQSCDMEAIFRLSQQYGFKIVEDAAHAVGAKYKGEAVGSCRYSDACVFSFHPVKIITTGEGGMITVKDKKTAEYLNMARTHGITKNPDLMERKNGDPWFHEQQLLGYNYRITDIQVALGNSQLKTLKSNIERRKQIDENYKKAFSDLPIKMQKPLNDAQSSHHLFVVLFENAQIRRNAYELLQENNIGTQVHYIPVHTQPYYKSLGFSEGDFPNAENYYQKCLSLPMFHGLSDAEQGRVIDLIRANFE